MLAAELPTRAGFAKHGEVYSDVAAFSALRTEIDQLKKHDSELATGISDMKAGLAVNQQSNSSLQKSLDEMKIDLNKLQQETTSSMETLRSSYITALKNQNAAMESSNTSNKDEEYWRHFCDYVFLTSFIVATIVGICGLYISHLHYIHSKNSVGGNGKHVAIAPELVSTVPKASHLAVTPPSNQPNTVEDAKALARITLQVPSDREGSAVS